MKNWKEAIRDKDLFWEWDKKTLTQDDWDFHWVKNVLDERLEAILLYEYAREQNQIRELGNIPQKAFKDHSAWDDYQLLCEWPFRHEVLKYFPQTPAKKIPDKVMHEMEAVVTNRAIRTIDFSSISDMQHQGLLEKTPTSSDTYKRTETVEIAAFEIDWELGPHELKRQFGNWLTREGDRAKVKERTSKSALLKALGIYRLLNAHKNFIDASGQAYGQVTENSYLEDYLYKGQAEWSKARRRAVLTIERLYPPYL
jgi:hypothetical protein